MLEGTDHTAQRADIQVQLGTVYAIQGQYQNARAQLEPALEQAREIGDRRVQALALAELARTVGMWQADYEAGMEYLAEAMPIAEELGDKPMLAFLLRQMGNLAGLQENVEDALEYLERSVELAREIGDDLAEAAGVNSIGTILQVQGQYADSLKYYDQGIVVAERIGDRGMQSMLLLNASIAHRARGDVEQARRTGDQSLSLAFESGSDYLIAGAHMAVGAIQIEQGEQRQGKDHLDTATQLTRAMGTESVLLSMLPLYARWLAAEGDLEAGWELLEFADAHPARDPNVAWAVEFEKNVLRDDMSEEQIQAAGERAAKRHLDEIIAGLMDEAEAG
jgi:tetratricopeptide (TPR) repeat protein